MDTLPSALARARVTETRPEGTTFTDATVTSPDPLEVDLDGIGIVSPDSLINPATLTVGDRVRVEMAGRRVVVHGRAGGTPEPQQVPAGTVVWSIDTVAPAGWVVANGQALSRAAEPNLFERCNPIVGTVTLTIASPSVVTRVGHGLFTGQMVYLTTTGALPTGLAQNTAYFVIRVTADTFRLATSQANANAGTAINTSGSQSGVHTLRRTYGVGNGSTTFNVPNLGGRTIVGVDPAQPEFDAMGETGGAKTHTLTTGEMPSHSHNPIIAVTYGGSAAAYRSVFATNSAFWGYDANNAVQATGGGGAHNNLQPYIALVALIKT